MEYALSAKILSAWNEFDGNTVITLYHRAMSFHVKTKSFLFKKNGQHPYSLKPVYVLYIKYKIYVF